MPRDLWWSWGGDDPVSYEQGIPIKLHLQPGWRRSITTSVRNPATPQGATPPDPPLPSESGSAPATPAAGVSLAASAALLSGDRQDRVLLGVDRAHLAAERATGDGPRSARIAAAYGRLILGHINLNPYLFIVIGEALTEFTQGLYPSTSLNSLKCNVSPDADGPSSS